MKYSVVVCLLLAAVVERAHSFGIGSTLYCWRCISTHPGCGHDFAWLWHWSQACPEPDDTCVKLIERKGAAEVITRDCLSSFKALRTDLPADHYEGCKHSSVDLRLAHYVNNSIKELDVKMNYYDSTEWCLCRFDNRCNGAFAVVPSAVVITLSIVLTWFYHL